MLYLQDIETRTSVEQEFVISREFNAPRALVFKAFTERERLAAWWGPKDFKIRVEKLDLKPGGVFHYSMTTPGGEEWWGRFIYREITPPERLVFVNSFSDDNAGLARAPFAPTIPLEMLSIVMFTEHNGKTTVALKAVPLNATSEEVSTFVGMRESMQKATLDQLAQFLANTH